MSRYDYHRPAHVSGATPSAWIGENVSQICNALAQPLIGAGLVVITYAVLRTAFPK